MILAFAYMAAESGEIPTFPFVDYLNLGVIVIILAMAYTRRIRFEGEVKEKDQRIEKLEAALESQNEHYQKEVLPALIEVTRVSGGLFEYLNRQRY